MNGSLRMKKISYSLFLFILYFNCAHAIDVSHYAFISSQITQKKADKKTEASKKSISTQTPTAVDNTKSFGPIIEEMLQQRTKGQFKDFRKEIDSINQRMNYIEEQFNNSSELYLYLEIFLAIILSIVALIFALRARAKVFHLRENLRRLSDIERRDDNTMLQTIHINKNLSRNEIIELVNEQIRIHHDTISYDDHDKIAHNFSYIANNTLEPEKKLQIIYARCPKSDGSFEEEYLSTNKEFEHLFRMIIDERNAEYGKLEIVQDSNQYQAINAPNIFLAPACEYTRLPGPQNSKIIQISTGAVRRINNRWSVDKKIKIEFN